MEQDFNCGFFVFDYNLMDISYGKQAFQAIYQTLKVSKGVCAFNDGDLFDFKTLEELIQKASGVKPTNAKRHLLKGEELRDFGLYLVSMWTDNSNNFIKLHNDLTSTRINGYLGYLTLTGLYEYSEFLQFVTKRLNLPQSICIQNGNVLKGTAKYGIGIKKADALLLKAAATGDMEDVKKAIKEGADVECIDYIDRVSTPLFHAANSGYADIVRILIEHGANPNTNNGSNTALMIASRFGHTEVVKALIEGGANVDEKDTDGYNAFDNADEHPEIQKLLRDASSNRSKKW